MFYGYVNIIRISHGKVSTFSVHQLVSLCPPVGLFVPVTRASAAHHVGIGRPCAGQLLPIVWATSAQISDSFLGNILVFGQYSFCGLFAMFLLTFLDVLIVFSRASCCL